MPPDLTGVVAASRRQMKLGELPLPTVDLLWVEATLDDDDRQRHLMTNCHQTLSDYHAGAIGATVAYERWRRSS